MPDIVRNDPPPEPMRQMGGYRKQLFEKVRSDPGNWYEVVRDNGEGWSPTITSDWREQFPGIETTYRTVPGTNPRKVRLWIRVPLDETA